MAFDRDATLAWLRTSPAVPVLIVGGGINGAGVLRELALNGVDALLVDKADFAAGATGASSRMIHGGLRYLENGEFRLVREALHERNRLLKNAPHCVFPLTTVIPVFSRFSGLGRAVLKFLRLGGRPGRRGAWLVRFGLGMYERFAGRDHALPRHLFHAAPEARRQRPALHPKIIGAVSYTDAWNPQPERLCLEVLRDALECHAGARALNYCALAGADRGHVELRDEVTGETFRVRPAIVINAAGAWIDFANDRLGHATAFIGGTKGSHLVVAHPELYAQTAGAEIFYENADGRLCLIFPVHGRVLVGTTDLRIDDPEQARCGEDEFAYLISAVQQVFPSIDLRPEHVVSRFCGVRPLPRTTHGPTSRISRDHVCRELPADTRHVFPVLSLVGGKWTTFRAFSEQVADRVFTLLAHPRRVSSRDLAIGGGRAYPPTAPDREKWIAAVASQHRLAPAIVADLFDRHGTTAAVIAACCAPHGLARIGPYLEGELDYMLRREAVVHLDDLVLRRTGLGLFGHLDHAQLARIAALAARVLSWTDPHQRNELARTAAILHERHGVSLAHVPS